MKKRVLFIGIAVFLVMVSYFAGESSVSEPECSGESVSVGMTDFPEEIPVEQEPIEEPGLDREKKEPSVVQENAIAEEFEPVSTEPPGVSEKEVGPAPQEGKHPVQTQETDAEKKTTCTLSVRCDEVLSNMDKLKHGKETIIPGDGFFCPETKVAFSEGESVFDVLYRELRSRNIHIEFVKTPAYNSVYIEGIGNLYEFDCGDYSGWSYRVNGVKPNVGCSQYPVKPGDVIHFYYTCNFLKDR